MSEFNEWSTADLCQRLMNGLQMIYAGYKWNTDGLYWRLSGVQLIDIGE